MAHLFQIEDNAVVPYPEVLLIQPFKSIWNRDRSKSKEKALRDFTYIEFMTSAKASNPYSQTPRDMRHKSILKNLEFPSTWKVDEKIREGMHYIEEEQRKTSSAYLYYLSAVNAADKMTRFFNNVDISEVNPKTLNPIYKPKDITNTLMDTEKVLSNLDNLRKKIEAELFETVKTKADKVISPFADPKSLM